MPIPVPILYFHKPERLPGEPSAALSSSVLAVVQQLERLLHGAVHSAFAGGLGSIDVEMKQEKFPERVGSEEITATPEALINEALEATRRKLAEEGLEVEAEEKRVSNRTRSAKLRLKVRKKKPSE